MTTHCPDCRSFSLTTAQLVSDSSSVGHRPACMVCREEEAEGDEEQEEKVEEGEERRKNSKVLKTWE